MKYDLTGQKFNRLTAQEAMGPNKHGAQMWRCLCSCGQERIVPTQDLRNGHTKSCGCGRNESNRKRLKTHGMSQTPEFKTWWKIQERCYNPKEKAFEHYGAKGVRVCDRWREKFENFFEDMGRRPNGDYSIDRIDGAGHYEPGNCRWATRRDQALNRRRTVWLTYKGERMCKGDWAERLGVSHSALDTWLAQSYTMDQIVEHYTTQPASGQSRYAWQKESSWAETLKRPTT